MWTCLDLGVGKGESGTEATKEGLADVVVPKVLSVSLLVGQGVAIDAHELVQDGLKVVHGEEATDSVCCLLASSSFCFLLSPKRNKEKKTQSKRTTRTRTRARAADSHRHRHTMEKEVKTLCEDYSKYFCLKDLMGHDDGVTVKGEEDQTIEECLDLW